MIWPYGFGGFDLFLDLQVESFPFLGKIAGLAGFRFSPSRFSGGDQFVSGNTGRWPTHFASTGNPFQALTPSRGQQDPLSVAQQRVDFQQIKVASFLILEGQLWRIRITMVKLAMKFVSPCTRKTCFESWVLDETEWFDRVKTTVSWLHILLYLRLSPRMNLPSQVGRFLYFSCVIHEVYIDTYIYIHIYIVLLFCMYTYTHV